MSYNVKYRLEYTGLGGYQSRIDILKRNYIGDIIEIIGSSNPFELVYESSDDFQFSIIKNSYCNLNVFESEDLKNDFLEIEDEDDFILRYFRNDILNWSGYVMAEQYIESDDINQPISIKFYDAISRLRFFNFNDLNLDEKKVYSLYELFEAVNSLLYSNLNPNTKLLFNNYLLTTKDLSSNFIDVIFLKRSSFFDKSGNPFNLYEVLENLSKSFNFTYSLYKERLMITNFEYSKAPRFFDYSLNEELGINKNLNIDNYENLKFINISKETTFLDALKKLEVSHNVEDSLSFIDVSNFTDIKNEGGFGGNPFLDDNGDIVFVSNSIEDSNFINRDYRKVSIQNELPIKFKRTENNIPYTLSFKVNFEFQYNITDEDINNLSLADSNTARNRRQELRNNTTFHCGLFASVNGTHSYDGGIPFMNLWPNGFDTATSYVWTVDNEDISLYDVSYIPYGETTPIRTNMVNIESMDNGDGTQTLFLCIDSAPTFFLASEFDAIDPPFTVMIDGICEIPGVGRRNEVFYINQGTDINQYERGFDVSMELRGLPNENELFIEFYQPNVFVGSLSSGNNHFYTSIIMVISDLKLVRNDRIDLSEIKIQGITDRNIFNYNLNRNRDYFYQDIEETDYKYTLVDSDGFALPEKSFIRKSKNNLTINNEELNVPELNLKQNLEQYKFQQKKITGELFVKNQFDFDILNSLKIDNKDFSIQKFILNDYDSVYDVELVEIKDVKIDEGFDIININITDANTSNYILIDSEDLFEPFQPTNREFAYYELNRNTSDSFENFANGENIGEFTFNTELEGVRLASFNGVNQYFQTDEELTSRGLIGTNGNNSNSIGVWLGFEEIPTTDKFIWIASNSNQSTFTGLKFNASNQKLEYIRFNQGSTNFNINNVIDEFTLVYNGAVAQEGDQFIYDGNTYDIVGVEPNVIYFLPALVGYTGDATPFIETQFQLIQNPVNSVVESQLTIEEGVLYTSFCRYNNQTGIQELFINNELQGSITNINSLSISQSDLTRVRLGNSEIEGFTKMNAGRFRIAGIFLDDDEIGRLGTKAIFNVNLRNLETGEILQIPQDWFVIVNNNQIGFNIPPEFQLGTFLLWISAGGIESPKLVFNIRPIQFRTSPMEVRFDNEDSLNQHFEALNKGWGGANGGVVASNCYIGDDGNGTTALVLESHGDLYTGSVQGVDNFGRPKFKQDGTPWTLRKGGCVISKEYLGFGSYEAEARVIPQLGVCSAFWNFHYQEIYPTDPRWEDYQKDVIDTSMMQPNLRSQFLFENNVNSISGIDTPTWTITDPSNTSYTTGVKGGSAIRYNGNTGWAFNITGVQTLGSFSNSYTVSLWVKINVRASVNQRHTIISNGTANNGAWGVQVFYGVNPEFQLVGKASGGTVVGTNNPNQKPYETWQHLVMVNNPTNNTMLLYIDGVLTQTVNAPSGTYNDVGWWRIIQTAALSGGGAGASVRDIEVADVRLINRAVDQLEARVMYGRPNFVGNPDFEGLGLRPIGNDEDGYYAVRNNEIDIEVPSQLEGGIIDEPSILNAKFNTWRGEYQNWDVDKNHPDYWEEYRDNYRPMGIDVTDGLYHKFRYDWYHDRVEFYIDDVLIITNYNYQFGLDSYNIPDVIGKYTMGNWFPSGARRWAGKNANFDIEKMYVKSFKYVPFNDEINNHQVIVGETYPRDGIVDLSGDSSVVRN